MNRKIINGLLLLSVATGGVGMLTSCKDNEDSVRTENDQNLSDLGKYLQDLIKEKQDKGDYATAAELSALAARVTSLENAGYLTQADKTELQGLINVASRKADDAMVAAGAAQAAAEAALAAAKSALTDAKTYVDDIMATLITSIQVQRCYNPMFGTFNLPMGISSTVLANYYYEADHAISFPNNGNSEYEYNTANSAGNLGENVWGALGFAEDGEGNEKFAAKTPEIDALGDLYVTINPTNIDCTGMPIRLVKSNGDYVLGELELAPESDEVFTFGYTRAGVNNGLYKVVVKPEASDIESIKIDIEPGLKSAFKDLLNSPSKSDLANLATVIYKQFDGILPAYAAEISTKNNADRKLISKYELAATTFHPLSFRTAEGVSINHRLPEVGHLSSILDKAFDNIENQLHFSLNLGIDESKYNFDLDLSEVDFRVESSSIVIDLSKVKTVEGVYLEGELTLGYDGGEVSIEGDNNTALNDFVNSIVKAVNGDGTEENPGFKGKLENAVKGQLVNQIDKLIADINSQLKGVDGQINDQIKDILANIKGELNGQFSGVNRLIDLYNKLANKLNNILDDPNAYLQIYAAYKDGNGDLHHLSTVASDPSLFTKGNGDAIQLYLTSYNAEFVVPIYKKYVAVVGEVGNPDANVKELNKNGVALNQVVAGRTQRAGIPVANLTPGKTYEILYSALDYRGFTSTRRFYIKVK